ncbi:hypothetical protein C2U72_07965 [Prosthecomicrobium hirschii]|uniref:hypothetical protein n=1 Tax=Prosthecodimorpha hirschii TaxID=665126 RepID=UPI001129F186|nr:hypothetical protein [Prosthecomicrobium hirschii]TPQ51487.1 hypothetical protein C2U72_07965 [Prosthecomicrobium hirschii]
MDPWTRLFFDTTRFMMGAQAASLNAAVTIAHRLPHFAALALDPTRPPSAEVKRAASEKMTAAWQGALAGGAAAQQLAMDYAMGRLRPEHLPGRSLAIAETALGPALKRVRSNARRLTRS